MILKKKEIPHRNRAAAALAKKALLEVTSLESFVDSPEFFPGPEILSVEYPCQLPGYPGWKWTLSLSNNPDAEATVLEVSLLPGKNALIAPEWVPWATRSNDFEKIVDSSLDPNSHDLVDEITLVPREDLDGLDIDQLDTENNGEPKLD